MLKVNMKSPSGLRRPTSPRLGPRLRCKQSGSNPQPHLKWDNHDRETTKSENNSAEPLAVETRLQNGKLFSSGRLSL
jgi:hypothetical protein